MRTALVAAVDDDTKGYLETNPHAENATSAAHPVL
jgi:hypothetical protein